MPSSARYHALRTGPSSRLAKQVGQQVEWRNTGYERLEEQTRRAYAAPAVFVLRAAHIPCFAILPADRPVLPGVTMVPSVMHDSALRKAWRRAAAMPVCSLNTTP